jgi:hypothetical protein
MSKHGLSVSNYAEEINLRKGDVMTNVGQGENRGKRSSKDLVSLQPGKDSLAQLYFWLLWAGWLG